MVCIDHNRVMFHYIGHVPKQMTLSMVNLALIGISIIDYIGIFSPIPHLVLLTHFFYCAIYLSTIRDQLIMLFLLSGGNASLHGMRDEEDYAKHYKQYKISYFG